MVNAGRIELTPAIERAFKRASFREDNTRPLPAQIIAEDGWYNGYRYPWPTHEPRVRMDIQTAVQIASENPHAWGCPIDLLCDSEPAPLPAHEWPTLAGETLITVGYRWRGKLALRARMARQQAELFPHMTRRATDKQRVREDRVLRMLDGIAWGLAVAGAVMFAMSMYSLWKNGV